VTHDLVLLREVAERRLLALRGAGELIAAMDTAARVLSLLELAGQRRIASAIRAAMVSHGEKIDEGARGKPDRAVWSEQVDKAVAPRRGSG
jgi:hypothetical protein